MKIVSAILPLLVSTVIAWAQAPAVNERPLPDITQLMHEVGQHQRASEAIRKNYLYHEVAIRLESDGKQAENREYDVFWLNGVQVRKMTKKDGKDLTPDQQKK